MPSSGPAWTTGALKVSRIAPTASAEMINLCAMVRVRVLVSKVLVMVCSLRLLAARIGRPHM
jgi:hypothetical protein